LLLFPVIVHSSCVIEGGKGALAPPEMFVGEKVSFCPSK